MRRLIEHLPEPITQNGIAKTFRRLECKDNEISYDANIEEFYDSIRILDDPSYPSAYLSLKNVDVEFSDINRECEGLFCQVRISPKDLKK
jgi:methionyl-tRNA formyltransferase